MNVVVVYTHVLTNNASQHKTRPIFHEHALTCTYTYTRIHAGNEPNLKYPDMNSDQMQSFFRLSERLVSIRDQECKRAELCFHPITIPLADNDLIAANMSDYLLPLELKYPHAVDFWSFQMYR